MKVIYILTIISMNFGCNSLTSKKKHFSTTKICDNIFVERYTVFGNGAFGGDLHSKYITDSLHFRKYIGTQDTEKERITVQCKGDSLITETYKTNDRNDSLFLFERKIYSKKELIKSAKFE